MLSSTVHKYIIGIRPRTWRSTSFYSIICLPPPIIVMIDGKEESRSVINIPMICWRTTRHGLVIEVDLGNESLELWINAWISFGCPGEIPAVIRDPFLTAHKVPIRNLGMFVQNLSVPIISEWYGTIHQSTILIFHLSVHYYSPA